MPTVQLAPPLLVSRTFLLDDQESHSFWTWPVPGLSPFSSGPGREPLPSPSCLVPHLSGLCTGFLGVTYIWSCLENKQSFLLCCVGSNFGQPSVLTPFSNTVLGNEDTSAHTLCPGSPSHDTGTSSMQWGAHGRCLEKTRFHHTPSLPHSFPAWSRYSGGEAGLTFWTFS